MTDQEIRETIKQMLEDWDSLSPAEKEQALKLAAVKSGRK